MKISGFFIWKFSIFMVVKFSIYLNRHVFVMFFSKLLRKLLVKYVSMYTQGMLKQRSAKDSSNDAFAIALCFLFSDFFYNKCIQGELLPRTAERSGVQTHYYRLTLWPVMCMVAYNWHLNIEILSRLFLLLCWLKMHDLILYRLPLTIVIATASRNTVQKCHPQRQHHETLLQL